MQEHIETYENVIYTTHYRPLCDIVHQMKISMSNNDYKRVLKQTSQMLSHLSPSNSSPEHPYDYIKLYLSITDRLHYIHNFFKQYPNILHLYTSTYETVLLIPRMYLQITIGSIVIYKHPHMCYTVLTELFTLVKTVNHPLRGLLLRSYLIQCIHPLLPDNNNRYENTLATYNDSLCLLMDNIEQMITLWLRFNNMNEYNELSNDECNDIRNRIIEAVGVVAQLEGTTIDVYQREVIPKVVSLIVMNQTDVSQQLLIESVIIAFKEEYNVYVLPVWLELSRKVLLPNVNQRKIYIILFNKLAKHFNNSNNSRDNVIEYVRLHFNTFNDIVNNIISSNLSTEHVQEGIISELFELQMAYMKLTFANGVFPYHSNMKHNTLDNIITLSNIIHFRYKQHGLSKQTAKTLFNILSLPLENNINVFSLTSYQPLATSIDAHNRRLLSIKIAEWISLSKYQITSLTTLKQIEHLISPLLYDDVCDEIDFNYEQNIVVQLIYNIHNERIIIMNEMYLYLFEMLIKGGEMRFKYTLLTFVNCLLSFWTNITTNNAIYSDVTSDNTINVINSNIDLMNKIILLIEMKYPSHSVRTCLMIHKRLINNEHYHNKAIAFYTRAIESYRNNYNNINNAKQVFTDMISVIISDYQMKCITDNELNTVITKLNAVVMKLKHSKDKAMHMRLMWYVYNMKGEFDKVKESVNDVKGLLTSTKKDSELFWIVKDILTTCIYFNKLHHDPNMIDINVIKEYIGIMSQILQEKGDYDEEGNDDMNKMYNTLIDIVFV
jgi:vacuolar protein sorting-associated protein 35